MYRKATKMRNKREKKNRALAKKTSASQAAVASRKHACAQLNTENNTIKRYRLREVVCANKNATIQRI